MSTTSRFLHHGNENREWRTDSRTLSEPAQMVSCVVEEIFAHGAALDAIPRETSPTSAIPTEMLNIAALEWFRTSVLELPDGWTGHPLSSLVDLAGTPFTKVHEGDRAAILAGVALGGGPETLTRTRSRVLESPQEFWTVVDHVAIAECVESLLYTSTSNRFVHGVAEFGAWSRGLALQTRLSSGGGTLLALGIRDNPDHADTLIQRFAETVREMDADLYAHPVDHTSRSRVKVTFEHNTFPWAVSKKGGRRLELPVPVSGSGGRIRAGLPYVLEEPVWLLPGYLMALIHGDTPMKRVKGGKSHKDVLELLSDEASLVRVHVQLEGDVSIDEEDLGPYRDRLDVGMTWVKTVFPDVKAGVEIVVSKA